MTTAADEVMTALGLYVEESRAYQIQKTPVLNTCNGCAFHHKRGCGSRPCTYETIFVEVANNGSCE